MATDYQPFVSFHFQPSPWPGRRASVPHIGREGVQSIPAGIPMWSGGPHCSLRTTYCVPFGSGNDHV